MVTGAKAAWQPLRHRRGRRGDDEYGAVPDYRDGRDESCHDQVGIAPSFVPVTQGMHNKAKNRRIWLTGLCWIYSKYFYDKN
jgi:hypothetical protein